MPRNRREIAYSDFNLDDSRTDEADPLSILLAIESLPNPVRNSMTLEEVTSLCQGEIAYGS